MTTQPLPPSRSGAAPSAGEIDTNVERRFLRHTLATLAYRAEKPLRDAPPGFVDVRAGAGSRSAGEILVHMCDLLDWALWLARGEHRYRETSAAGWEQDRARFFAALAAFDAYLASDAPLGRSVVAIKRATGSSSTSRASALRHT